MKNVSRVLCLIAVIMFVLAAFGVTFSAFLLVPMALAFLTASMLVP